MPPLVVLRAVSSSLFLGGIDHPPPLISISSNQFHPQTLAKRTPHPHHTQLQPHAHIIY